MESISNEEVPLVNDMKELMSFYDSLLSLYNSGGENLDEFMRMQSIESMQVKSNEVVDIDDELHILSMVSIEGDDKNTPSHISYSDAMDNNGKSWLVLGYEDGNDVGIHNVYVDEDDSSITFIAMEHDQSENRFEYSKNDDGSYSLVKSQTARYSKMKKGYVNNLSYKYKSNSINRVKIKNEYNNTVEYLRRTMEQAQEAGYGDGPGDIEGMLSNIRQHINDKEKFKDHISDKQRLSDLIDEFENTYHQDELPSEEDLFYHAKVTGVLDQYGNLL